MTRAGHGSVHVWSLTVGLLTTSYWVQTVTLAGSRSLNAAVMFPDA